jgi:hypothetical protein
VTEDRPRAADGARRVERSPGRGAARVSIVLALLAVLAGCSGPLPYRPERQPFGATISADVRVTEDRLRVEIGSEGYRVEWAMLVRDGGVEVAPEALVPGAVAAPQGGMSIGLGVGTGGSGSSGSYSIGSGVGVGLGGPGSTATTLAVFRLDLAGPPPWRLRVKVIGVEPVAIVLDPAARRGS